MEWSRAKTILIIAYAIFDIFLGYRIWTDPGRQSMTLISRQQVEETARDLASRGILLATPVPRRAPTMPLILLRHGMNEEEALELFFEGGGEVTRTEKDDGRVVLENPSESLERYENGILVYAEKAKEQHNREQSEAAARWQAEEFWSKRGGLPPGAKPDYVMFDDKSGRHIVQYYQEHDGFPIYGGQISMVVGQSGIETVLFSWFSPVGPSGKPKSVLGATEALVNAAEAMGEGTTVESVTLGYYSEAYNARQWEAPPVWRIRTKAGETLYVNAYTGELEGPMSMLP